MTGTRGLDAGWSASRWCWWNAAALVDPLGPDPARRLPHLLFGVTVCLTPAEAANRYAGAYGDIMVRDPTGVLRVVVGEDHRAIAFVGAVWPETVLVRLSNRPLPAIAELPFPYPTGVFVSSAANVGGIGDAPAVRLRLSRPLWSFGPIPFDCGEECGD